MTRRSLLRIAAPAAAFLTGCVRGRPDGGDLLRRMAESSDLAILGLGQRAISWNGRNAGRAVIESCCRSTIAVAPDARCLAWVPFDTATQPAYLTVNTRPKKEQPIRLECRSQGSLILAISDAARTIAVFTHGELQLFDSVSG